MPAPSSGDRGCRSPRESADRNTERSSDVRKITGRSPRESADRNTVYDRDMMSPAEGRSPRESADRNRLVSDQASAAVLVALHARARIETPNSPRPAAAWRPSLSTRERGSKRRGSRKRLAERGSLSTRERGSKPAMRATLGGVLTVALHARARIETATGRPPCRIPTSLSTRERGSKHHPARAVVERIGSLSTRERGSKQLW